MADTNDPDAPNSAGAAGSASSGPTGPGMPPAGVPPEPAAAGSPPPPINDPSPTLPSAASPGRVAAAKNRFLTTLWEISNAGANLIRLILTPTFLMIVFVVLCAFFVWSVALDSSRLTSVEYARGLITLLFSVGTLAIAVLLTISAVFPTGSVEDSKATFDRGKEVTCSP